MSKVVQSSLAAAASGADAAQGMPQDRNRSRYAQGVLYCLVATVSFGLMFPVMASALTHIDPFTFTSLRYVIAAGAALVLLRFKEGPAALSSKGESVVLAWVLGSIGFAGFGFLAFLGQQLAGPDGALTASIMAATQPLLGVLINSAMRRVLPPSCTLLLVILSFAGVGLVITNGDVGGLLGEPQNYWANGLIVLGMICWLFYTFGAARFTTWSPLKYTTMTMILSLPTIVSVNLMLAEAHLIALPRPADLAFIVPHVLYMSLVASLVGVLCWNIGNSILTPLNGVLFMDVVPITAFIVSAIAGVMASRIQVIGACVAGSALILNNLYLRYHAGHASPPSTLSPRTTKDAAQPLHRRKA